MSNRIMTRAEVVATLDRPATAPVPASAAGSPVPIAVPGVPPLVTRALIVGVVLTGFLVLGLSLQLLPVGALKGKFLYPYVRDFSWERLWPAAAVLAAALGLLWLSRRVHERFERSTVVGWLVAAVPLQLVLRWYAFEPVSTIVASDRANSFYSPTSRWSALDFISPYLDLVRQLPPHARTNMPGKTMLYYLLGAFTESPAALGILIMVVANLGALLVYLIVREWLTDRRAALYALVLCLFMPGMMFFLPVLNTVSAVPILLALWLHVRFIKRRHWAYAALLGPALYLTVFFEPLPLVMGLVFVGVLALALRQKTIRWTGAAQLIVIALTTFAVIHVTMRLALGYDLLANLDYVFTEAQEYNVGRRPYNVWVVRNVWDFAVCAGMATAVLILVGAWDAVRGGIARPAAVLTLAGLAVLAFLDLAGINRGETVRLWIFIAAFLQIVPAWLCARTPKLWPFAIVLAATVLQAVVGLAMIGFVRDVAPDELSPVLVTIRAR